MEENNQIKPKRSLREAYKFLIILIILVLVDILNYFFHLSSADECSPGKQLVCHYSGFIAILNNILSLCFYTFFIFGLYKLISGIFGIFHSKENSSLRTINKKRIILGLISS